VPTITDEELEGTTLKVYVYVVKEGHPVGPRDVMRGVGLSSPSVAYRHLQKLENLGLLEKTTYGQFIVKEKVGIKGHVWIGRSLVSRLIFYSFFFIGVLGVEVTIIAIRFYAQEPLQTEFIFLTIITALAMILFLFEGIILHLKVKPD